jgi:DNA (cytosine-5)-methyltransferase 1
MGYSTVEICAGAGGQALGLELAGFEHALAVELDPQAANTLAHNRPSWPVAIGDVASSQTWKPADYLGLDLLAGGVPCPPFSVAGRQIGAGDERDLFAWTVAQMEVVRPRALMLENVRGLSTPRFAGYRQRIADELARQGYWSDWRLVHASQFGVPQLRPRYVLVAMKMEDAAYFAWPEPTELTLGLGTLIGDQLGADGWAGATPWAEKFKLAIAPTIVGGSKRHGGADLGPTRAKSAWRRLGIDAHGVADAPPTADAPEGFLPRLTTEMVARIQGWLPPNGEDAPYAWEFTGRKTSRYRQIGNAFPPPVARAIGGAIYSALSHSGSVVRDPEREQRQLHDPVLLVLQSAAGSLSLAQIAKRTGLRKDDVARKITNLERDFDITIDVTRRTTRFALEGFRGFVGQSEHARHRVFAERLASIS